MATGRRRSAQARGFTTIELVVVIVVIGILAVAIAPRFTDDLSFKTRGFYDEVFAAVEYARQQAMAQRRSICVLVIAATPRRVELHKSNSSPSTVGCNPFVVNPVTGTNFVLTAPTGVTVSPAPLNIAFDWYGRPIAGGGATVTVSGSGSYSFVVEAETGHVH